MKIFKELKNSEKSLKTLKRINDKREFFITKNF